MAINIGLDIGAIGLKLAAIGEPGDLPLLEDLCASPRGFRLAGESPRPLAVSSYRRIAGSPIQSTYDLLQEFYESVPETQIEGIRVTGSGSRTIAKILGIYFENEFKAIAHMIGAFYPDVRTVFEIGGESSKYIRLEPTSGGGPGLIVDYDRSGECAAGHRVVPRPAGAAHAATRSRRWASVVVRRASRGAHRRPLLGLRQVAT